MVQPSLDVNKTSALVSAAGEELTIEVTSNVDWTASADQDWVSVDPSSGKGSADAAKVKVTVDPNEAEETRAAVVTVVADQLTKTLKITQAGANAPEPETYILVGEAVGGWDPVNNGVILILEDGDCVGKAVSVTAKKGMHFTKNAAWEGNVKGKHGLIAPNEIGEVGSNDISLTEGGKFDVYLTEALDKFYFMSEGKLPSEAVEHVDIAVSWGICGAYGNNNWGSGDPDTELVQDGEWYVAKNIEFSEVNFKIRGNNSWADDVKWGRAAKDQKCELNKAIAVSTCTEYKEANPDAGDNENIYIGGSGTYDVYFSPEKKEVWVMTPGYKPGDETPEITVTYTVTGTIKGTDADKKANYWNPSNEPGLMVEEDGYLVAKNIEFDYDYRFSDDASGEDYVKFKICETGTWNAFGQLEDKAVNKPNTEITVKEGGHDIYLDRAGLYDVYLDKTNGKVWVMEAGYKPGEEIARLDGNQWMAEVDDMQVIFDLGVTEEGMLCIALPTMDGTGFGLYMTGFYEIEAEDKQSGVILFMGYDWEYDEMTEEHEFVYSDLTASTVKLVCETVFGVSDPVTLTKVETPYEIEIEGGGEDPEGAVPNGEYWFLNGDKVMAPLAEGEASGIMPAAAAVNGASTAKNAFTLTYYPELSYYTIQDSYGRYLGNSSYGEDVDVVAELPAGDDQLYYLWTVALSADGTTYEVYNAESWNGFSCESGSWKLSPGFYENADALPALVPADNPVDEPAGDFEIDGKQWVFSWEAMMGVEALFDLGVTAPGSFLFAYDMSMFGEEYTGVWFPYYSGSYTVEKTNGSSGVIKVTLIDPYEGTELNAEIPYTMSSEDAATFDTSALKDQLEMTSVSATAAKEFIDLSGGQGGGESFADGNYWIVSGGKVATPLTGNYGYLQTVDAVGGKSTAANAFTFTCVDQTESLFAIQDSNGKYLYQEEGRKNFNVSSSFDRADEAFYWQVFAMGDGTYYIANYLTMQTVQYDANYGSYGCYAEMQGVYPELILAEDPIEEPEPTPGESLAHPLTSNVVWTIDENLKSYSQKATVNGTADVDVLKMGTSSVTGTATVAIPAGTKKIGFYGVAWKGKKGTLVASAEIAGGTFFTQEMVSNDGASNNSPYTITASDETDYYEFDLEAALGMALPMDATVTLSTAEGATRVIVWGLNCYTE